MDICHKKNPQTIVLWACGFKDTLKMRFDKIDEKFEALNKLVNQLKTQDRATQSIASPLPENEKPITIFEQAKQLPVVPIIEKIIPDLPEELVFIPSEKENISKPEQAKTIQKPLK